ncbi:MAG: diguanylate cyclase [Eubacteriales bacterium]
MKKKISLSRVDIQVSILIFIVVIFSCGILYYTCYTLAYNSIIHSLEERAISVAAYASEIFDIETFENIQTQNDIHKEEYIVTKDNFKIVRDIAELKYLYSACYNADGLMIYHIDGLPFDEEDFRYPGDPIEPEFQADLLPSLNGEIVMPDTIVHSEWGDVFTAYFPLFAHNNPDHVIGAIGMEFDATEQYIAFKTIRQIMPIVILLTCIASSIFAYYYFRRISNPTFRNHLNTDSLTKLKNRRAFDVDMNNLFALSIYKNPAIIIADINRLKHVNDTYGHTAGDAYIKSFATTLQLIATDCQVLYRIGGDEFVVIMNSDTNQQIEDFIHEVTIEFSKFTYESFHEPAASFGYATCHDSSYEAWTEAFKVADKNMYQSKSAFYKQYDRRL